MTPKPVVEMVKRSPARDSGGRAKRAPRGVNVALVSACLAVLTVAVGVRSAQSARWSWSGSGVLDYKRVLGAHGQESLAKQGAIAQWNIKATVEVSEKTTVSARVCTSCHGLAVDQASAEIRFAPPLNLEAGRFNVPFGDFYLRHDPANDAFLSKPLPYEMGHMLRYQQTQFNLGVIPMPYVDQGASVFGDVWIEEKLQIWYGAYAVNGFRAGSAQDFAFLEQSSTAGFNDNNRDLSWGGRLALAQGAVAGGASYLRGAYDVEADYAYHAWGVDLAAHLFGAQMRGEYLQRHTEVATAAGDLILRKAGFYAQVERPVRGPFALVGRIDGLLREGPPLSTDNDDTSGIFRWTLGLNVAPAVDYAVRFQYEHWRFTDFGDADVVHVGAVVTF
jgi:hypothetical protein